MSFGVLQSSALGPDLWNLLYDDLLKLNLPNGVELITFLDDVAVVSTQSIPVLHKQSLKELFVIIND